MKEWHYQKWTSFIAYDFLRMEMVPQLIISQPGDAL
jgi:hypothetical protein